MNELPELPKPEEIWLPTHVAKVYYADQMEDILRSYALSAVLMERERCAKLCEERGKSWDETTPMDVDAAAHYYKAEEAQDCAAAIRSPSKEG